MSLPESTHTEHVTLNNLPNIKIGRYIAMISCTVGVCAHMCVCAQMH